MQPPNPSSNKKFSTSQSPSNPIKSLRNQKKRDTQINEYVFKNLKPGVFQKFSQLERIRVLLKAFFILCHFCFLLFTSYFVPTACKPDSLEIYTQVGFQVYIPLHES